jgi:hypothetical protein
VGEGEGEDVQVQDAVYEGDVHVPEDANGLGDAHVDGAVQVLAQQGPELLLVVVARVPAGVVGFFALLCGFGA